MEWLTNSPLGIRYDGTVTWFTEVVYSSDFEVNVKWFPFDTQVCVMRFTTWAYAGNEIEIFADVSQDGNQNR